MITIDVGDIEYYDSDNNTFEYEKGGIVRFEYSLKALYEWEAKWMKPFLKGTDSTHLSDEEIIDFYHKMALDPIDPKFIKGEVLEKLSDYIKRPSTATTFVTHSESKQPKTTGKGKVYTSEEIYSLMFKSGIPLVFEERNLNRLLVILRIISSYNEPPKKMNPQDVLKQNASLNAQRKAQMKTKG